MGEQRHSILSRNVCVKPKFREEPDINKFGRTFITVAMRIVENRASTSAEMGDAVM